MSYVDGNCEFPLFVIYSRRIVKIKTGVSIMAKKSVVLAALFLQLFISLASAITVSEFEKGKKNDKDYIKTFITGVGYGFSWIIAILISEGRPQLYCVPGNLVLNDDNYIKIIDDELVEDEKSNKSYSQSDSIELILFFGLERTFPCKK